MSYFCSIASSSDDPSSACKMTWELFTINYSQVKLKDFSQNYQCVLTLLVWWYTNIAHSF